MDQTSFSHYKSIDFFNGKNIIVTGANGGIGSIIVKTLIDLGANVLAIIRNEKKFLALFRADLNNSKLRYEVLDFLTIDNQLRDNFKNIIIKLGGKLDCIIMCHALFKSGSIENTDLEDFDHPMTVNVRSSFHLLSLASPFLKQSKGNCVIISSLEAKIPTNGNLINSVTKSMINSLIQCSALELASFGVRVNGVAPGITKTKHRVGSIETFGESENQKLMETVGFTNLLNKDVIYPQDVANSVLFLASDDASFITGEIIEIDNGFGLNHDNSFSDQSETDQ